MYQLFAGALITIAVLKWLAREEFDMSNECQILQAINAGDIGMAKLMIENGVDVNELSTDGISPLILTLKMADRYPAMTNLVPILVQAGANVNHTLARENSEVNALLMAMLLENEQGSFKTATYLIEHGVDMNEQIHIDDFVGTVYEYFKYLKQTEETEDYNTHIKFLSYHHVKRGAEMVFGIGRTLSGKFFDKAQDLARSAISYGGEAWEDYKKNKAENKKYIDVEATDVNSQKDFKYIDVEVKDLNDKDSK